MILKRKIYDKLLDWKTKSKGKKAILIEGARRIGKSTVCEEFGKNEYKSYIIIDFAKETEEVKEYFASYLNDLDTLFMLLSTHYGIKLYQRDSLIIFDEVQMYPKARAAIKYLVADGRYDYLETGSLISIKENVKDIVIPSEERHLKMFPLDFEEFAWANGVGEKVIDTLRSSFEKPEPYNNIVYAFQEGFVDLARQYRRRTGKELCFVPMYIAPALKKAVIGSPVRVDPSRPFREERARVCHVLAEDITAMARALPEHRVVPYPNLPRRDYPLNTQKEVSQDEKTGR